MPWRQERIPACLRPKDIHRRSHDAGVNAAKYGAGIGGTISGLQMPLVYCKAKKARQKLF